MKKQTSTVFYQDVFYLLEKSEPSSVLHPGLTQWETDVCDSLFRKLRGHEENTHLSVREVANRCSQSYHRARKLVYRMLRSGTQVSPMEFRAYFQSLPPYIRLRIGYMIDDHHGGTAGYEEEHHHQPSTPPDVLCPPNSPRPTTRRHEEDKPPPCCVIS